MIDRYFDAMDLNNTEIYIEWETPKSKNGPAVKSVSETYLKIIDDEHYPGKLIFGWAISDAITKESGTLKFAVRFVQWNDDKKLVYSFNTLTAQATVHPNLGLDLENDSYEIDNCNSRLLERIEPSVVVGGVQAAVPYFLQDLVLLEDGYDIVPNHTDGTLDLSVIATADDTGVVSYVWKRSEIGADAWVEVPGSTAVSFVELTAEEYEDFEWKLPQNRIFFIEREDNTAYLLPKGRYDLTDADTKDYFLKSLGVDLDAGEVPSLFEKRSILKVEKYGQYKAEARNRIFNSLTKAASKIATFKTPEEVEMILTNQTEDKHIIGFDSALLAPEFEEAVGDLAYQWYRADEVTVPTEDYKVVDVPAGTEISYGKKVIRMMVPATTDFKKQNVGVGGNPNKYYVTLLNYIPEGATLMRNGFKGVLDDEYEVIAKKSLGTDEHGLFRKVWFDIASLDTTTNTWTYRGKDSTEFDYNGFTYVAEYYDDEKNMIRSDAIRIEFSNEDCHKEVKNFEVFEEIVDDVDLAQQSSYNATTPGFYKMEVTRTRNRASVKGESIEYRVTNAPVAPNFTEDTYDAITIVPVVELEAGEKELVVAWEDNVQADEFYVSWYLFREDNKLEDLHIITNKVGGNVFSNAFNPTDELFIPVFEAAGEDVEGFYYAIVKTKLNGVESEFNARPAQDTMFSVTGS